MVTACMDGFGYTFIKGFYYKDGQGDQGHFCMISMAHRSVPACALL